MDGPAIFTFAITTVPRVVKALMEKAGLTPEEVDWYVYHQANKYMLDQLRAKCRIPPGKFLVAMSHVGNTVSSTIPSALKHAMQDGRLKAGDRVVLVGFGVGRSWAAAQVKWAF